MTKQRTRKKIQRRRKAQAWLVLAIVGVVLVGALGVWMASRSSSSAAPPSQPTDVAKTFPQWLASAPAKAQRSYAQTIKHQDELGYVPCYCGCEKIGHVSVADCHVDEIAGDGSIAYDIHAVG